MNDTTRLFMFLLAFNIAMSISGYLWPINGKDIYSDLKGVIAGLSISAMAIVISNEL